MSAAGAVLVVDDEVMVRDVLAGPGYQVTVAGDGEDALRAITPRATVAGEGGG